MLSTAALPDPLASAINAQLCLAQTQLKDSTPDRATGLHEARKHLKRARALVRLAGDAKALCSTVPDTQIRDLARRLGPYRDADAMLEAVDRLAAMGSSERELLAHAREVLAQRREQELAKAPGYRQVGGEVAEGLGGTCQLVLASLTQVTRPMLDRALQVSLKRLHKARRQALGSPGQESFHAWRKRAKTLMYQSEWLGAKGGGLRKPMRKRLNRLSELLGEHHDLYVLELLLGEAGLFAQTGQVEQLAGLLRKQRKVLEKAAAALGAID